MTSLCYRPLLLLCSALIAGAALAEPEKHPTAEQSMAAGEKELVDVDALRLSGDMKAATLKLESALFYFTAANELAPDATGPLLGMGLALSSLGRCKEATPILDNYLDKKAEASNPAAREAQAHCLVQLGKAGLVTFHTQKGTASVLLRQSSTSTFLGQTPTTPKALPPGDYDVLFLRDGEKPITRSLTVKGGEDLSLTTNLKHPRLSWNPGALGVPRVVWWISSGLVVGAGAALGAVVVLGL